MKSKGKTYAQLVEELEQAAVRAYWLEAVQTGVRPTRLSRWGLNATQAKAVRAIGVEVEDQHSGGYARWTKEQTLATVERVEARPVDKCRPVMDLDVGQLRHVFETPVAYAHLAQNGSQFREVGFGGKHGFNENACVMPIAQWQAKLQAEHEEKRAQLLYSNLPWALETLCALDSDKAKAAVPHRGIFEGTPKPPPTAAEVGVRWAEDHEKGVASLKRQITELQQRLSASLAAESAVVAIGGWEKLAAAALPEVDKALKKEE